MDLAGFEIHLGARPPRAKPRRRARERRGFAARPRPVVPSGDAFVHLDGLDPGAWRHSIHGAWPRYSTTTLGGAGSGSCAGRLPSHSSAFRMPRGAGSKTGSLPARFWAS